MNKKCEKCANLQTVADEFKCTEYVEATPEVLFNKVHLGTKPIGCDKFKEKKDERM